MIRLLQKIQLGLDCFCRGIYHRATMNKYGDGGRNPNVCGGSAPASQQGADRMFLSPFLWVYPLVILESIISQWDSHVFPLRIGCPSKIAEHNHIHMVRSNLHCRKVGKPWLHGSGRRLWRPISREIHARREELQRGSWQLADRGAKVSRKAWCSHQNIWHCKCRML